MSYVDAGFYAELVDDFADWPEKILVDLETRERCRSLLEREARLLDQGRFEDWLAMYSAQCIYWIPATPGGLALEW